MTTPENGGCCLRRYYHLAVWGMLSSDRLTRRLQGREWVRWAGLRYAAEPTLTRQRPLSTLEDGGCCLGLCAHGVVGHALWGAGKGMAMTIRKMEYGSAC